MKFRNVLYLLAGLVIMFAVMRQCEGEPKVVTKTVTKIIPTTETITEVKIDTIYTRVFIDKIKTVKGKDSIVYRDTQSDTTIEAKEYKTELKSNNAIAKLDITTTGELLDLQGVITYPKVIENTTTTITRDASGFFLYAQMPISSQITTPELGIMLQFKNKIILGVGGQYNSITNNISAVATLAVKL